MARLIKVESTEPLPIEIEGKKVWICTCGLTDKFPYCSGKHKYAREEELEKIYIYDQDFKRKVVKEIVFQEES